MQNLRGITLMVLAMAGFAAGDVGIKLLSQTMPLGQIISLMSVLGTAMLAIWTCTRGLRLLPPTLLHRAIVIRFGCEAMAAGSMTLSLALVPLSVVTAILQAGPLVVAMGAAVFFAEQVGWRRWGAILVGLIGVLVILRPGTSGFDLTWLWPVLAMLALAGRDLATRAAPKSLHNLQMATFGFLGILPAGFVLWMVDARVLLPDAPQTLWLVLAIVATVLGYLAITAAMRVGEIAVVTPFRYTRLIFGLILGVTFFGERPDWPVFLGSALVVASGIYTILRERRLRQIAK